MRLLLKLFAVPVMLALTILAAMLMFLFDICSYLLTVASVITALLGIGLFFTPTPHGGVIFLFLAFLLSPYGLQAVAGLLIEAVDGLGSSLRQFLVS